MGWKLKKRDDVEPLLPLKRCFCFDNRMGTFVGSVLIFICNLVELITVVIDWFTYDESRRFNVMGAFMSFWKRMFWKGFVICDGVMTLTHIVLLAIVMFTIVAILQPTKFKIYSLKPILKLYCIILLLHILIEVGVSCYIYSWYGLAAWRLPFLVWKEMFYIIRFIIHTSFLIVIYSYLCEITEELNQPSEAMEEFGASTDKLQDSRRRTNENPYSNPGYENRYPVEEEGIGVYANA